MTDYTWLYLVSLLMWSGTWLYLSVATHYYLLLLLITDYTKVEYTQPDYT